MDIQDLGHRKRHYTYRIGDNYDLVVIENLNAISSSKICQQKYGIIFICEGSAQFEYDGALIQLQKNDLFIYLPNSAVCNVLTSADFNCRMIWFKRNELWDINMFKVISLANLEALRQHPLIHLTNHEVKLCDTYFQLLCHRMKASTSGLAPDIIRSLFGTMLLELGFIIRCKGKQEVEPNKHDENNSSLHKMLIIDNFLKLVEKSDGRIRRVDEFACQLNVTPKYLSTILKEVTNRRSSDYIQIYTLKAIKHRLRFTDMTMQEIANDLKFPNPSFFGKYCKEHLGMTPRNIE